MLLPLLLVAALSAAGEPTVFPHALPEVAGNLEGVWRFRTDPADVGEQEGWFKEAYDTSAWRTLRVPGCWEAQGVTDPRPGQQPKPKNGLPWTDYDGVAWYILPVTVPKAWHDQDLDLLLGSVDDADRTYFNGHLVGETGLEIDHAVTVNRRYAVQAELVHPGETNLLAIRVEDGGGPGGLMGPLLSLLPHNKVLEMTSFTPSDAPLAERFAKPPAESRILKIVHHLPDDPKAQDTHLQSLLARGFGGMATNVSFQDYMVSETKWAAFTRTVHEARKAGMALWLYDEKGYPSGTAGGIVMRDHPEWEARGLLIAQATTDGGPVTLDVPPGDLVSALALPVSDGAVSLEQATDLSATIDGGKLTWDAPDGSWHIVLVTEDTLYEGTHAAVSLADKLPYIDLLSPEPTARFLEVTHDAYVERLGSDLGAFFTATFTDEPSLMDVFMRPQPYSVLPWSLTFPAEFKKRRGYDIEPMLPALFLEDVPEAASVRYDFWLTVGELVSENYFGQIQDWCAKHNIPSGGHLICEESLLLHVPFYGDFMRCVRRLDAPSMDCLTSLPEHVPWYVARMIGSVAELEGRSVTMCETSDHVQRYRPPGDERPVRVVTEDEIRGTCNRLIANGITTITSYYSFSGLSTEQLNRLNEWLGRCSTMLAGGHQVADIALVYPVESVWPRFAPSRLWTQDCPPEAQRIEHIFRGAAENLYAACREFTYVDAQALADAKVEQDALAHGALRWRVVILPCVDTLPAEAWDKLADFWRAGGVVVALGVLPANCEGAFPSAHVQELAHEMFGTPDVTSVKTKDAGGAGVFLPFGAEALLPAVVQCLLEPDMHVSDAHGPIRATHRRIDGHEVYFVMNDSGTPWEGQVSLAATGSGERWDPATGTMLPMDAPESIPLQLEPYGGVFFRFAQPRLPQRLPATDGDLPKLHTSTLFQGDPHIVHGEFVEGALAEADASPDRPGEKAWQSEGRITKSDTDTFCFVAFDYTDPVDLSKAACVAVTTRAPEDQDAATKVVVILRDGNGIEAIANTSRVLSSPGRVQSHVPMNAFKRAPWNQDTQTPIDLSSIAAIRVGWGGYLGTKDQRIVFTLTAPEMVQVGK